MNVIGVLNNKDIIMCFDEYCNFDGVVLVKLVVDGEVIVVELLELVIVCVEVVNLVFNGLIILFYD